MLGVDLCDGEFSAKEHVTEPLCHGIHASSRSDPRHGRRRHEDCHLAEIPPRPGRARSRGPRSSGSVESANRRTIVGDFQPDGICRGGILQTPSFDATAWPAPMPSPWPGCEPQCEPTTDADQTPHCGTCLRLLDSGCRVMSCCGPTRQGTLSATLLELLAASAGTRIVATNDNAVGMYGGHRF